MTTLSVELSETGATAPMYTEIVANLQDAYRVIFGSDIYIEADSQDGQLLSIFAKAISDCNDATIGIFNSYSPTHAKGTALSNQVKLNGIKRDAASNSYVTCLIVGRVGTTITNGSATDINGVVWNLPETVYIGVSGQVVVSAICSIPGDVVANIGAIQTIATPTYGWQTIYNTSAATVGTKVETDAVLRTRQSFSAAYPSIYSISGLISALANLTGLLKYKVYVNDTAVATTIPANSIAVVTSGGDATEIANTIAVKKPPGIPTSGSTSIIISNITGLAPLTINYTPAIDSPFTASITVKTLTGYVGSIDGLAAKTALFNYINNLDIGQDIYIDNARALVAVSGMGKFHLTALVIGAGSSGHSGESATDKTIAFSNLASITMANIFLNDTVVETNL
jgi:uncharacterized phage protein gp47/JayE